MSILVVLIPVALLLGLSGLAAFFWAVSGGQYDDLEGAALRILIDDTQPLPAAKPTVEQAEWPSDIAPD